MPTLAFPGNGARALGTVSAAEALALGGTTTALPDRAGFGSLAAARSPATGAAAVVCGGVGAGSNSGFVCSDVTGAFGGVLLSAAIRLRPATSASSSTNPIQPD